MLSTNAKKDGWVLPEIKLVAEVIDLKNDPEYENTDYMRFVKEIIKMPYLNRLKQFLLRLLRNNLLLGKRAEKVKNPVESKCYICGQHKESRVLLFLECKKIQEMTQFLTRVLKKAGFLKKGCEMSLFFLQVIISTLSKTYLWQSFGILYTITNLMMM